MEYLGESLSKAASEAVSDLAQDNAQGGVIALDDAGNGAHCQISSGQTPPDFIILGVPSGFAVELPRDVSGRHSIRRCTIGRNLR